MNESHLTGGSHTRRSRRPITCELAAPRLLGYDFPGLSPSPDCSFGTGPGNRSPIAPMRGRRDRQQRSRTIWT